MNMDMGNPSLPEFYAVFPDKPFQAMAYKVIVADKSKINYAIRKPLNGKEIQLLTDFVGRSFTATVGYFTVLKELLIQRCNRQNPDNMTWDEILAAVGTAISNPDKPS